MAVVLCVDDDAAELELLERAVRVQGHEPVPVSNGRAALQVVGQKQVDLILTDYRMPEMSGLELIQFLDHQGRDIPIVVMTGYGSVETAVAAIRAGATDYITKPVTPGALGLAIDQALEYDRLKKENEHLRREVSEVRSARQIVGDSPGLTRVLDMVKAVALTRATVLIQGESGTGKELIARTVHHLSDRSNGPFISVNCAAIPENLVESTLFGHEKGAFTGAVRQVKGAFERADGGTLLLDEVSEMRVDLQAKLLRVLQEQEFERVGGSETHRVDVRVIATTNRDLQQEAMKGNFREDLYYRLSVVPVAIPPLRDRLDDIPALIHHFLRKAAKDHGRPAERVSPEAVEMLQRYPWPGNVRELAHSVERAVILSSDVELTEQAFDDKRMHILGSRASSGPPSRSKDGQRGPVDLNAVQDRIRVFLDTLNIHEAEEVLIERALELTDSNRTKAADLLGISVRTLRSKLNRPLAG
ncbi:MAG: sigma-54-dependent Fis family transcriptional regulator [Gemmatimonadetes bacterium]|nr:sigma-54-dependent Fis family transcriptional regulator [Gemmatimonadota bacterium]